MSPALFTLLFAMTAGQAAPTPTVDSGGIVTLPLSHWSTLTDAASAEPFRPAPPAAITYTDRSVEGVFRKGLLSATLRARFEVHDTRGYLQVPIISDGASPGRVTLNGVATSLVRRGGMYTVGVDKPGAYQIEVLFFRGHEQDRFARRLQLDLPEGGVTSISIGLPETDIEAKLAGGALSAQFEEDGGTRIQGYLDASGRLDLSWTRKLAHRAGDQGAVRLETRMDTLITLGEGLVSGVAVFNLDVREGETDRFDLVLPADVEVMKVTGDAVLQWRSDPSNAQGLSVLLRHLVRDESRVVVHFQYAVATDAASVPIKTLLPPAGTPFTGILGVQAPAGLDIAIAETESNTKTAQTISLRELPSSLTRLTTKPLRFGFRFDAPPTIALTIARHASVELTSTLIDELQASTVLLEDGVEVTKMRLDLRNNTRQYLEVILPTGAELTHALLDGQPVRPALSPTTPGALLFTLRQSERIDPGTGRIHEVRPGDTLGGLAHRYLGDPGKWARIQDANTRILGGGSSINVGQRLQIPTDDTVTVEESAFVLEMAYRTPSHGALTGFGTADLALPTLDIDVMRTTWHVYVPPHLAHLDFATNLTQVDHLRYGIFRRMQHFLGDAFSIPSAWAGGDYKSILSPRRSIYHDEVQQKTQAEVAPATFPYVGQRYRFQRVLSDAAAPRISFTYLSETLVTVVRILAFILAALMALFCLSLPGHGSRRWKWARWAASAVGMLGLMVVAHYILGVHRMLVWGVAAGVLVALWRVRHLRPPSEFMQVLRSPWELMRLASLRNIIIGLGLIAILDFMADHRQLLPFFAILLPAMLWKYWVTTAKNAPQDATPTLPPKEVAHVAV